MEVFDCIRAAESGLDKARRYLESGEGANLFADSLGDALLWAMEGWLIANGHQIRHGRGWADTRQAFLEHGPAELRSRLMDCYAEAIYLDFDLMGGIDDTWTHLPMVEWKRKAFLCLEKTEESVGQLIRKAAKTP